ncbi:MAG TPA: hypothetical protein VK752_05335 [Bryobacteraceae bacterium]|jgi:hypothetical protein|nr:hypothetical protein [Bryobacteraceae bacterium]
MSQSRIKIGPSRQFPRGHLNPDDEGELTFGIAADAKKRVVVVNFGSPVHWLALPVAEARRMALVLNAKADEIEGSTIDPELPS